LDLFEQALNLDPYFLPATLNLASLLNSIGDKSKALSIIERTATRTVNERKMLDQLAEQIKSPPHQRLNQDVKDPQE